MIEIIYKGDDDEKQQEVDIKLPKNVRQIGSCEHESNKLYVEDFVMAYVKRFSSRKLKYGVLLGSVQRGNGNVYLFITGAVCAKPMLDNEIIFDDDVWTGIYEDVKTYFDEVEIVGWFASMPGILENDMPQIQKIHLDNFAGNDRVCFLIDQIEGEDSFYVYDDGGMKNCGGYYIYYEKNADMQSYMVLHQDESEIPENYEQSKKRSIHSKVHRMLFQPEQKTVNELLVPEEKVPLKSENKSSARRKLPTFAYSASSFMLLAVLLVTVAVMNASGQLKDLKSAVANIGKSNEEPYSVEETPKVIDVAGGVEPTSDEASEQETTQAVEETNKEPETTEESTAETTIQETTIEETTSQEQSSDKATVAAKEQEYYTVKAGDSLYSISMKNYGNMEMIDKIKEVNGIIDENYIKEGQRIVLP